MTTMTDTTDDTQLKPVDPELMEDYQTGAVEPQGGSSAKVPPRGAYTLRLPEVFDVRPTNNHTAVGVHFGENPLHPLVIADGEFAGYEMRFVSLYTTLTKGKGESSAGALLRNFGVPKETIAQLYGANSLEQWRAAFAQFAGQTTPSPVWCDWEGDDRDLAKQMRAEGASNQDINSRTRYRGMGAGKGQGLRFTETDAQGNPVPWVTLGRTTVSKTGETRPARVWARLKPTFSGFMPKGER